MDKPDDLGLATLRHVRETLALEEKWTLDEPRGFAFWGCDRRQRAWAEETVVNRQGSGIDTCRLHAEVDLLGPGALTPKVREHAELLSETFPLSAIRLRTDGRLVAHCAVEVRSGDDGMVDLFTQAVALQWACARSVVPGLSEAMGRAPDSSHHPKSRERQAPCRLDGWLRVVGDVGNGDSAWTGEEEKERTIARLLQLGFTCGREVPAFPRMSFWVGIPFPQGNDEDSVSPAMVHVETDGEHPWLGRGAWVKLWLPPHAERMNVGLDALALGDLEARQDVYSDLLGSWRWAPGDEGGPSRTLVQAVFLPNQLFRPGRLLEVVQGTVWRAKVLADFYADAPRRNMDGSWRPEEQGPTLVGDVRLLVREQRAGWRAQLSEQLEQAARGGAFLETMDVVWAVRNAGQFSGAVVFPHADEEAPYFRWTPACDRHFPTMDEKGLLGLTRYGNPQIAEASTDLGILAWQAAEQDETGLKLARALEHFERAAVRGCARGAFNAGCMLVTTRGLSSLWRAVPMLRFAVLMGVPDAQAALAWVNRWGRFSVRWLDE